MMRLGSKGRFPAKIMRQALTRAGGICECHRVPQLMDILKGQPCGARLNVGDTFYEHIVCTELRPDNSLDNCAVLTRTCWRLKTDRYDLPAIAEAKRRGDRHNGIHVVRNPLPGGKDDRRKRALSGMVIDRETGEKWGVRNG